MLTSARFASQGVNKYITKKIWNPENDVIEENGWVLSIAKNATMCKFWLRKYNKYSI